MIEITNRLSAAESAALESMRAKRNRLVLLGLLAGVALVFGLGIWHVNAELRGSRPAVITAP
jgi:hypothetical protein